MLNCPKCGGSMREVRREGVVVDRCTECGGIFLDAGELEHFAASERAFYGDYDDDDDDDRRYRERPFERDEEHRGPKRRKKKKKHSFLEDLLDFG